MYKGLQPTLVQVHVDWAECTVGAHAQVMVAELPERGTQYVH